MPPRDAEHPQRGDEAGSHPRESPCRLIQPAKVPMASPAQSASVGSTPAMIQQPMVTADRPENRTPPTGRCRPNDDDRLARRRGFATDWRPVCFRLDRLPTVEEERRGRGQPIASRIATATSMSSGCALSRAKHGHGLHLPVDRTARDDHLPRSRPANRRASRGDHVAPALQDRDPVGEIVYVVDIWLIQEECRPLLLQLTDSVRPPSGSLPIPSAAVGSSMIRHRCVREDRRG